MSDPLYQFTTKLRTIQESVRITVLVFKDHAVIQREGRTSHPRECSIDFRYTQDITFSHKTREWITFHVAGHVVSHTVVTAVKPGTITLGGYVPYEDPYSVVFGLSDPGEAYYKKTKAVFDEFKANYVEPSIPATTIAEESALDKLKKLKELKDMGVLSDEEYEEKRKALLNQI